jgi:hypothetical protein
VTGAKGTTGATGPASQVIGGGTGVGTNLGVNAFMSMFNSGSSTTESQVQQPMPVAGTLKNFIVRRDAALSAATQIVYTVRKNGVDTAVTCTITFVSGALTCSDLTHSVVFAAGDLISIGTVRTGTPAQQPTRWTAQYQ